jgi:hypothetical protein
MEQKKQLIQVCILKLLIGTIKPSNLRSHSCNLYNSQLDKIKSKVNSIYMILRLQEIPFLLRHDKYLGKELKKSEFVLLLTNNISLKLKN